MKVLGLTFALSFLLAVGLSAKPEVFELGEHKAYIEVAPKQMEGKPWIWYAPTVNGKFIILGVKKYRDAFLDAGISIATCDLGEVRGAPGSTAKFTQFYEEMVKRGYSKKPILIGQSRGGLMTLAWAVKNPDKVGAWVGIYPVCNLESYPLRNSKKETLADFGMDEATLRAKLEELNPISNLAELAKHKVPLFAVHGDKDGLVPYNDNTKLLKERYEKFGGNCEVKIIVGAGHDFNPGFFENQELIDFVINQVKKPKSVAP